MDLLLHQSFCSINYNESARLPHTHTRASAHTHTHAHTRAHVGTHTHTKREIIDIIICLEIN